MWVFGVIGIAWTGLNYAVPRFEQKLQTSVQESISTFASGPLVVSTLGRDVTLSGQVASEEDRQMLVAAVNAAPGVASVDSQLSIMEIPPVAVAPADQTTLDINVESDSTQTELPLLLAQSSTTEQPLAPPTEENEYPPEPGEADVAESNVANNDSDTTKQAPSINIKAFGNILSIEGKMSASDDTSSLVKNALDSFNLDVVSNGLILNSSVARATWLDPLQAILPLMSTMANAHINVTNQQLTLSGIAPTREVHDAIINKALASIGNFSLIEKMSVQGALADTNAPTLILTPADPDSLKADEQAQRLADQAAKAEASEQARLAAEAAAAIKASEDARLAAEATDLAKLQEEQRLATMADAKAAALIKAQEERIAATAKAVEQARLAEAAAARAKTNEQARQAAITAAKARAEERARLAAEAAAATQARAEERARLAAQTAAATQARAQEQARLLAEAAALEAKLAQTTQTGGRVELRQALQDLPSLRILFGTEGNRLTIDSLDVLDQIAETIIQYPDTQVVIEGHTDATGELDQNLQLSLLRATTVRDYLIRQGVSVYNLRAIGVGEAVPLVSNDSPEGRAKNRRIEFTFR